MKDPSSSSSSSTVVPEKSFESFERYEKIKNLPTPEQRIYQLAREARAHGMFSRIPPCDEKVLDVVEAIIEVIEYEQAGSDKPPNYIEDAMKVIEELDTVDVEKLTEKKDNLKYVLEVYDKEYQNYTTLCLQRGYEEKGELFQLISYFPKIGILLRKINDNDSKRYNGVIEYIDCSHSLDELASGSESDSESTKSGDTIDESCEECEEDIVLEAEINLHQLSTLLKDDDNDNDLWEDPENQSLELNDSEKTYKLSVKSLIESSPPNYSDPIGILKEIKDLDDFGIKKRDELFENRVRQQKLAATVNIFHSYFEEDDLSTVADNIKEIGKVITENDTKTEKLIRKLHGSFSGAWESVRRNMNSPSLLSGCAEKIFELTKTVQDLEEENKTLKEELAAWKATKSVEQGPKEHDNKQAQKRKAQEKEDDCEDDGLYDTNQPSTSSHISKRFC